MGAKLLQVFTVVEDQAGMQGRMQLAERTGITRNQAYEMVDRLELLMKLKTAANSILGRSVDEFLR